MKTEFTPSQDAGEGFGVVVMPDSCELVLFMLMVLPSCEGNHGPRQGPQPYSAEALIRRRIRATPSWSNKLQRRTKRMPPTPPTRPFRNFSTRSGWNGG